MGAKISPIAHAPQGHVICVVGGKDGIGKSVLTANLGLALAIENRNGPIVVDLDANSTGDLNLILGINRVRGFGEQLLDGSVRDLDGLKKLVTVVNIGAPGAFLSVLQMFSNQERILKEDPDRLLFAIKTLRKSYPLVILDCGHRLEGAVLKAMDVASLILVVTTPDVLVFNKTKKILDKLQMALFPPQMTKIVLNRQLGGYNYKFLEESLRREVIGVLPEEEHLVMHSLSKGRPFVVGYPDHALSKEYFSLARVVGEKKNLEALNEIARTRTPPVLAKQEGVPETAGGKKQIDPRSVFKLRVQAQLIEKLDLKKDQLSRSLSHEKKQELREKAAKIVTEILLHEDHPWKGREESAQLAEEILNEALGLGPLEDLLANDDVTEIMVNRADKIYIEKSGKTQLSPVVFSSNSQLLAIIERIVNPLGRRIDEKTPYVDARLADGSRVHAIIPPLAIDGPMLTIRKFPKKRLGVEDLIKYKSITPEIGDFLRACIQARLNVLVSGGTGSGKTTLLNILSSFIPNHERILTVEDSAELQLHQEHVGRLETRPANIEGTGEVTIRDLVKQTLRMRPDRIIVGEVRAGEALDMLQAMNTGHDGSMATIHANTPRDCLSRLETLVMMAGMDLPVKAVREQIASAVQLIVQQSRLSDGSRKVTYVTEVIGMQGDRIETRDIFYFRQDGVDQDGKVRGVHMATGFIPGFMRRIEALGIKIPPGLFKAA